MSNLIDPKNFGLEKKEVLSIEKAFQPKIAERQQLEKVYRNVIKMELGPEAYKEARELRLKLVKVRTGISSVHKSQKQYFLAAGRFVDAWKNKETLPVAQMEERLLEIEKHEEIQLLKAKQKLADERRVQLQKYVDDVTRFDLGDMDEDVFLALLQAKKQAHEDRIEAERKAEAERIALEKAKQLHNERKELLLQYWNFLDNEAKDTDFSQMNENDFDELMNALKSEKEEHEKEQKRIREENERLRLEREESEKKAKIEAEKHEKRVKEMQPYIVFIRNYNRLLNASDEDYSSEFSEIKKGAHDHWNFERQQEQKIAEEKKQREEKERKEREAYEAKLKEEREEKERIANQLKAKQEAEEKAKREEEARIESELNKSDKEKVNDLIAELEGLKTKYELKSAKNKKMLQEVSILIDKIVVHIKK